MSKNITNSLKGAAAAGLLGLLGQDADAANFKFTLVPSSLTVGLNEAFTLDLYLNTEGQAINYLGFDLGFYDFYDSSAVISNLLSVNSAQITTTDFWNSFTLHSNSGVNKLGSMNNNEIGLSSSANGPSSNGENGGLGERIATYNLMSGSTTGTVYLMLDGNVNPAASIIYNSPTNSFFTQSNLISNDDYNASLFANPTLDGTPGVGDSIQVQGAQLVVVPEPGSLAMLAAGLPLAYGLSRRRRAEAPKPNGGRSLDHYVGK